MTGRPISRTAFFIAAALLFAACRQEEHAAQSSNERTAAVRVFTAETRAGSASEQVPGTVRPKLRAVIEAKVSGRVARMLVAEGQRVAQGAPLADIDAKEIQARLDQALVMREQAERELRRFKALIAQRAVTQSEFDAADARARIARGAVEEAQAMLAYTHVTAPFAGVITRKLTDVGDLAAPGKPLFQMEDAEALRFEAGVPESVTADLSLGSVLPVRISNLEQQLEGRVSEIAPTADPNTRTYLVKLDLPQLPALRSGQFGHVAVPLEGGASLFIPGAALVQRGQMELVYVVVDGEAFLRLVRSGKRQGEQVQILAGLAAGETVVAERVEGLRDGQRVTPLEEAAQ